MRTTLANTRLVAPRQSLVRPAATAPVVTPQTRNNVVPAAAASTGQNIKPGGILEAILDSFKFIYMMFVPMKTRQIVDDPSDANGVDFGDTQAAKRALTAGAAGEQQALAKLGAAQQAQYQSVKTLVGDDPVSKAALMEMLTTGKLTGQKALVGGGDMLSQLAGLAKQDLATGVDRAALTRELLVEIQNTVRINQHDKGTCAATTAQILLARRHPAEYVRLVAALASPAGTATMAGGSPLKRDADWTNSNDGGRTTSSRLIQPAIMNAAQGIPGVTYHNTTDMPYAGPVPLFLGGMTPGGSAKVNTQLEGVKYKNVLFMVGDRANQFEKVKAAIAAGYGSVPVGVEWNADGARGGHELQVDKVEGGKVFYTNPWGQQETMDEREFLDHITSASVPQG